MIARWANLVKEFQESTLKDYGLSRNEFLRKFSSILEAKDLEKIRSLPRNTYFIPRTLGEPSAGTPGTFELSITFDYKLLETTDDDPQD